MALEDFETLLTSVVPYKAFSKFLHADHPEMLPYLQMVMTMTYVEMVMTVTYVEMVMTVTYMEIVMTVT